MPTQSIALCFSQGGLSSVHPSTHPAPPTEPGALSKNTGTNAEQQSQTPP